MIDETNITDNKSVQNHESDSDILSNVEYICKSTKLISDALRNGCDIAQLPNGDIMVTETKIVHMQYAWNKEKAKMIRLS